MSRNVVGGNALSMRILRIWMWLVPLGMVLAAVVLGAVAASDGKWGLVAAMVFIGTLGLGMLFFHYWLLYRFGKDGGQQ